MNTSSEKERIKADYENSALLREAEARTGLRPNALIRESLQHYLTELHIKELSPEDFAEFKSLVESQTNQKHYFLAMLAKKGELRDTLTLGFNQEKDALMASISNLNSIITEKDQAIEALRQENDSLKSSNDLLREKVAALEAEKEHLKTEALSQAQILSLLKDIGMKRTDDQDNH